MNTSLPIDRARESEATPSAWQRFLRRAETPSFLTGASAFRIVAGFALVYQYLVVYTQRHYLFGPDAPYPFDLFVDDVETAGSLSLYALSRSELYFEVVYHVSCACVVMWWLGVRTRYLTLVVWLLVWSLHERNPYLLDGGDNLIQIVLLYACLIDVSARWSFDAWRARRTGSPTDPTAVTAIVHNAGVLACAIQLCLVYGVAGLYKVQGETWQNGTALYYSLRGGEFVWPGMSELIYEQRALLTVLAYATVAFQLSFPFLLFLGRRTRLVAVTLGIGFHLGIMSFMSLFTFAGFMLAVDLMFVTDDEYAWVRARLARLTALLSRTAARLSRRLVLIPTHTQGRHGQ